MSLRPLLAALPLALALSACQLDTGPEVNPFTGCYDNSCVDRPQVVPTVPALVSISTKSSHVCGLTADGEAWCWGDNSMGQLGDGTSQPRSGPVQVVGETRFSAISVGILFSCALALDGTAHCWGLGTAGTLGRSAPDTCGELAVPCATSPVPLAGHSFIAIGAGFRHTCAVDTAGVAWCWGFNFLGETGSDVFGESVLEPEAVTGSSDFAWIGAGDAYTCALTTGGRAYCWGSGERQELGRQVGVCGTVFGYPTHCTPVPGAATTSATFATLAVGNSHVCGLTPAGSALCWGDNGQGQLGRGGYEPGTYPAPAHAGMTFSVISASSAATCATPTSGASVCWGLNLMGKLGIGSRLDLSAAPLAVFGNPRYSAIAGGDAHVCALTEAGSAQCWGSGRNGQLGTGERLP